MIFLCSTAMSTMDGWQKKKYLVIGSFLSGSFARCWSVMKFSTFAYHKGNLDMEK